MRQDNLGKNLQAGCAQRCGGFFKFFFGVFKHRLHSPHDKGQTDKNQRNHDTGWRERQLDAQGLQVLAYPAVASQDGRQRDTGDGGWQGKWQINQRIDNFFPGKLVAHQHPGQQQSEHQVDQRGKQRGTKREAVRGHHTWRGDGGDELLPAQREGFKKQRRDRYQHDQAEIKNGVTQRQPKARQDPLGSPLLTDGLTRHLRRRRCNRKQGSHALFDGVQLVELSAVIEVDFLRLTQGAEHFLHREELQWFEGGGVFFQYAG